MIASEYGVQPNQIRQWRRSGLPRLGLDSVRRNRNAGPGSEKMMSGALPNGTYYIYSFDGRLLAEYDVSGFWIRDYIYFGGQLVAEYRAATPQPQYYFCASDQINSTRIVTDSTGTVVYAAAHEPYGGIQKTWVGDYDPELKFSGKPRDTESELDYFGARYYDRAQYRFMSVDPMIPALAALDDPQRWNLYAYCRANPLNYLDPDGKQSIHIMRYHYGSDATYGIYKVELGDKVIYGYTLEPARGVGKGPIPLGTYPAKPYWWAAKGYEVYWLQGVVGFSEIFIHRGNLPEHTDGCQLVGKGLISGGISGSKAALDELLFGIAEYTAELILGAIGSSFAEVDYLDWLCRKYVWVRIEDVVLPEGKVSYTWRFVD